MKAGVIEVTDGNSQPSLTRWDVLDEAAYKRLCEKHSLGPKGFVVETEEE